MGVFDRFRRSRRTPYAAVTDEERISRYLYLLSTLPPSVIESAHQSAFKQLPPERRREMFEQLRPFMSEEEQKEAAEPELLARLVRRAEERRAEKAASGADAGELPRSTSTATDLATPDLLIRAGVYHLVAPQFLLSTAVFTYYSIGAGSIGLAGEPGWVGDIVDPGGGGSIDGSFGAGGGGFDGGGYDAGGFSGFDAGGFGGGFDGGGGGFG